MPVRDVAYRRVKLIGKRIAARATMAARYGQSESRWPFVGAIEWSIAR